MSELQDVLGLIEGEVLSAQSKFPSFHSPHEGYAILREELDEAWDEIKGNRQNEARQEMIQVAAMAVRFLLDCPDTGVDRRTRQP